MLVAHYSRGKKKSHCLNPPSGGSRGLIKDGFTPREFINGIEKTPPKLKPCSSKYEFIHCELVFIIKLQNSKSNLP